ncbi:hypothetical protein ACFXGA_06195 [Actinosynnema sp. NPDC059335]|uniref:hypothetical protein n=1 Tax=Actinosynnema sp. NPDC059335 TaxID=3346804 RepID=UPI00366AED0D
MTALADPPDAAPAVDLSALEQLPREQVEEMLCAASLGVWTERRRGMQMSAVHWEWCALAQTRERLAVIAPREHSKSETFSVNATAHASIYQPGCYTYMFALTGDLAEELLARTKQVISEVRPDLVLGAQRDNATDLILANGSRIRAAGAAKRTRGGHPDRIVGDDVLDDENTATAAQRRKMHRWWFGSVVNMAHPGTDRRVTDANGVVHTYRMPATRIHLVGTPFHGQDLLAGMKTNPMWHYRRYAAEAWPNELVPGTLAVEVTG